MEQNENIETAAEQEQEVLQNEDCASSGQEGTEQPQEEPKELSPEEKIAALEKENAELKDQLLRRAADFDNYRKRMIKEKQETFDYANASLLQDLLESLDNLERTVEAAQNAEDAKTIAEGVKMTGTSLMNMLESKYALSSYGAKGDEFNPEQHEAIGMLEADVEKEVLGEVYVKGYKLKDRIIRLAKVMVHKPKVSE